MFCCLCLLTLELDNSYGRIETNLVLLLENIRRRSTYECEESTAANCESRFMDM